MARLKRDRPRFAGIAHESFSLLRRLHIAWSTRSKVVSARRPQYLRYPHKNGRQDPIAEGEQPAGFSGGVLPLENFRLNLIALCGKTARILPGIGPNCGKLAQILIWR